jgi:hypothetical protein
VVVGGQISLDEAALVTGDVVTIGGQLNRAEGAQIQGEVVNNVAPNITIPSGRIPPPEPESPSVPVPPEVVPPNINVHFNPFAEFFGIIFWAVGAAAFSMLLALFLQPQITRTGNAIVTQPLMTGAIGLASVLVAAILFLTILPPIFIVFAWFFGVVALGQEVGERFTKAINQEWSPVLTVPARAGGWSDWLDPMPGRHHALPARSDRGWRLCDHLIRNTTDSGSRAERLYPANTAGRDRRGATRFVVLKFSHVIINPPRAVVGRIYFIEDGTKQHRG